MFLTVVMIMIYDFHNMVTGRSFHSMRPGNDQACTHQEQNRVASKVVKIDSDWKSCYILKQVVIDLIRERITKELRFILLQ